MEKTFHCCIVSCRWTLELGWAKWAWQNFCPWIQLTISTVSVLQDGFVLERSNLTHFDCQNWQYICLFQANSTNSNKKIIRCKIIRTKCLLYIVHLFQNILTQNGLPPSALGTSVSSPPQTTALTDIRCSTLKSLNINQTAFQSRNITVRGTRDLAKVISNQTSL